jgi:hypothetical protein
MNLEQFRGLVPFQIYYEDFVYDGISSTDWKNAPAKGVQVVLVFVQVHLLNGRFPDRFETGYVHCGATEAVPFTGVNYYDPLNFGIKKEGTLMDEKEYFKIWERARASC